MLRPILLLAGALGLAVLPACSESTRAQPFPVVAGTYRLSGSFDDSSGLLFAGPMVITQPSRDGEAFGGYATVTLSGSGQSAVLDEIIVDGAVTRDGAVSFSLSTPMLTASWHFTGTLTQRTLGGRQTVTSTNGASTGPWQATRTEPRMAAEQGNGE